MKGRVFLVHWREAEAYVLAREIRNMGWDVEFESNDGERVGKRLEDNPADVVVIYLTRLPSHGRDTGAFLRTAEATQDIPLIYVDGNEEAVRRTQSVVPDAIFTTTEELDRILSGFCTYTL